MAVFLGGSLARGFISNARETCDARNATRAKDMEFVKPWKSLVTALIALSSISIIPAPSNRITNMYPRSATNDSISLASTLLFFLPADDESPDDDFGDVGLRCRISVPRLALHPNPEVSLSQHT